jgi:hypothetical protein
MTALAGDAIVQATLASKFSVNKTHTNKQVTALTLLAAHTVMLFLDSGRRARCHSS